MLAVVRLPPNSPLPVLPSEGFFSLTRTREELSLVVSIRHVPAGATQVEAGWRAAAVIGVRSVAGSSSITVAARTAEERESEEVNARGRRR